MCVSIYTYIYIYIYILHVWTFIGDSSWKSKRGAVNLWFKRDVSKKEIDKLLAVFREHPVLLLCFPLLTQLSLPHPTFHPLYSYCPYHLFILAGSNCSLYIFYSYILLLCRSRTILIIKSLTFHILHLCYSLIFMCCLPSLHYFYHLTALMKETSNTGLQALRVVNAMFKDNNRRV